MSCSARRAAAGGGVLALVWAPGVIKKTPLDVDTRTLYEGEGGQDQHGHRTSSSLEPVYAMQETKADSENSSDEHVLFVETSCLVVDTGGDRVCVDDNDPNLLTADIDIFATDRVTALAVADPNLPPDAVVHEGLVNKWPFDVEKKTYPYWDGLLGRPVDMVYDDTEEILGLETYRFVATVEDEPVEVAEGVPGTYSNVVTVNVDPTTGSIVKGAQDQQRYLDDGTQVLDVDIDLDRRDHRQCRRRGQGQRPVAQPAAHGSCPSSASSSAASPWSSASSSSGGPTARDARSASARGLRRRQGRDRRRLATDPVGPATGPGRCRAAPRPCGPRGTGGRAAGTTRARSGRRRRRTSAGARPGLLRRRGPRPAPNG